MNKRNYLINLAVKYRGNWDAILTALQNYELCDDEEIEKTCASLNCETITLLDDDYPEHLKRIRMPPFVLFYKGDKSLLYRPDDSIAVVGTRHPTSNGLNITSQIVRGLPNNRVIVSGMAYGIDTEAHRSAINSGHKTIAVLGCGLNTCYPAENAYLFRILKRYHLVVSEYPPDEPPSPSNFPMRNRIVIGLANYLLVTAALRKSGTMITVHFALDQGKDVMCVPSSNVNNSACNVLLKEGAFLVENSEDVTYFTTPKKHYRT